MRIQLHDDHHRLRRPVDNGVDDASTLTLRPLTAAPSVAVDGEAALELSDDELEDVTGGIVAPWAGVEAE